TEFERFVHLKTRVVAGNLFAIRSAEQFVNGLPRVLAANIPKRQIDAADGHDGDALASVKQRGVVHLLPDGLDVEGVRAGDQRAEMMLDDVSPRAAATTHAISGEALVGLDLDQNGAAELGEGADPVRTGEIEIGGEFR